MVLKLNRIAILILWGKYRVFVVPIDKTIKGNSYLNLKLVLQDFQIFYVTLFKIGFGTLQVHFNQWGGLYASKWWETSYRKFWMSQTWNPIPNKKVMTKMVILYRLGKELFEQCDIKSLEKSCRKLDSWRVNKTSCMLLYRYKVTKNIFCETFKVYLSPYWQNTVWNLAKCNSVTFWKSFRMFSFLKKMII